LQGDLRLTASRVEIVYGTSNSQISRLLASGGVTFVTAEEAAEAEQADYDVTSGLLLLTGEVLLTQGASAISAEQMTINVTDGTATMDGRVRTLLQQGDN
jgi:lipopolysaccharide export system protein LptA